MAVVADHVFKAFAVSARGAIFERLAPWQRNESQTMPKPRNSEQTKLRAERISHANQTHQRLR
jgi:hypothetical protein